MNALYRGTEREAGFLFALAPIARMQRLADSGVADEFGVGVCKRKHAELGGGEDG